MFKAAVGLELCMMAIKLARGWHELLCMPLRSITTRNIYSTLTHSPFNLTCLTIITVVLCICICLSLLLILFYTVSIML